MSAQRFIISASVLGLVILTIALYISSLGSLHTAAIASFQRTGDPNKIVVNVTIGLGTEVVERSVREDAKAITVTVGVRQSPGTYPAVAFVVPVLISLKDPLADRAVLDPAGHTVNDVGGVYFPGTTPRP